MSVFSNLAFLIAVIALIVWLLTGPGPKQTQNTTIAPIAWFVFQAAFLAWCIVYAAHRTV